MRASRRRLLVVALAAASVFGISCHSLSPRTEPRPEELRLASVRRAAAAASAERRTRRAVRDLVREHRPRTSESWRRTLADAICDESLAAGVDPLLVASIVAKESSFHSRAVSDAGAVGLMQLRPWVARDVASRASVEWPEADGLHDPHLNVRLGILYYKELVERFDGDRLAALTAYNYGPTRVRRQQREGTYRASRYAREILDLYEQL